MNSQRPLAAVAAALVVFVVGGAAATFLLRSVGDVRAVVGVAVAFGLVALVSAVGRRGLGETPYW